MRNGSNGAHAVNGLALVAPAAERYAHIVGWGMAVPNRVMTNDDLARIVDTTDEWITSRTGIRQRRIASNKESTSTLAAEAGRAALDLADIDPGEVDLIIVATCTPDHFFPATACLVQDILGCSRAGAFDLSAACSGFIYGLSMGTNAIRTGMAETVLVIGAETLSRFINWHDRGTCVLFGDGAGAFVLQARPTPGGLMSSLLRSDGSGGGSLILPAGGARQPATFETVRDNLHTLQMDGKAVYRFATRVMTEAIQDVTKKAGLSLDQVQLIVPHQANRRIIESSAKTLGLSEDRFMLNLDRYGNTSAASIPIAVCEAVKDGRLRPDDHMVLVGFGAGLTWGAAAVHWDATPPPEPTGIARVRRQAGHAFARVRSLARRSLRQIEGALFGSQTPEGGQQPPRRKK
jgi:3-oxoacyl-[acyl-carrier-protein] synthase-3